MTEEEARLPCTCGHLRNAHWDSTEDERNAHTGPCYFSGMTKKDMDFIQSKQQACKYCPGFKLDNLQLVENKAKAKGLI